MQGKYFFFFGVFIMKLYDFVGVYCWVCVRIVDFVCVMGFIVKVC